jgi:hypothetical protein
VNLYGNPLSRFYHDPRYVLAGTSDNWQNARIGIHAWNANSTVTGAQAYYLHKAQHRLLGWILQYGFGRMFVASKDQNQLVNDLAEMVAAWGTPGQLDASGGGIIGAPFLAQSGASAVLVSAMHTLETLMTDPAVGVALEEDDENSADYWRGLFSLSQKRVLQVEQQVLTALAQSSDLSSVGSMDIGLVEAQGASFGTGAAVTIGGTSDNYLSALAALRTYNQGSTVTGDGAFYLHKAQMRLRDWIDAYGFGEIFVAKPDATQLYTDLGLMIAAFGAPSQRDQNGGGIIAPPWLPGQGVSTVLVTAMKALEYVMANASVGIALEEDNTDSEDYWHGLFRLSLLKIDAVEESAAAQGITS